MRKSTATNTHSNINITDGKHMYVKFLRVKILIGAKKQYKHLVNAPLSPLRVAE